MSGICSKCKVECVFKEGKGEQFGFPCDVCRTVLCRDCAELSATEIRFVAMATRALPYLCRECISSLKLVPILKEKILELEQEVKDLKNSTQASKQSYADILKTSLDHSDELKSSMKDLERKVENISKSGSPKAVSGPSQLEPAVQELQERESRAANILIFGVRESEGLNRDERVRHENEVVEAVLQKIDRAVTRDIKVRRLGKYDQQKIRPIRVTFPTKSEALNILKQKGKLSSDEGIYIKGDQTVSQRNYLKEVIAELETRTRLGEKDLKIRYINYVPKIIKIHTALKKN